MVRKAANTETYEITIYPCDQGIARLQFLGGGQWCFPGGGGKHDQVSTKKNQFLTVSMRPDRYLRGPRGPPLPVRHQKYF